VTRVRPRLTYAAVLIALAACGEERKLDPRGPGMLPTGFGGASLAGTGGLGGGTAGPGNTGGGFGISECPVGGSGGVGGGVGGHGGGGRGGAGGSDPVCPPTTLPDCVGTGPTCGDGKAETCLRPAQGGLCPKYPVAQACDGADLGQQTCESQGFGSGTIACLSSCTLDVSACRECTTEAGVIRCGDALVGNPATSALAVAATASEVALAWAAKHDNRAPTLNFARLDSNLDVVNTTALDDPAFSAATGGFKDDVTVIVKPLPSGWVVAGYAAPDVFVHAVDATGHGAGRITLANIPVDGTRTAPIVAGRPSAGPLVVWVRLGVVRAAVVSIDGRAATAPITLPIDTAMTTGPLSAAFVGDAFYVAAAVYDDVSHATSAHLRLVRVPPDGSSATAIDALPGLDVSNPQIVEGADELRIVYAGRIGCVPGYHKLSQRVSPTGQALSPPVRLANHDRGLLWGPPLAAGADTTSLQLGFDHQSLTVLRSASDGTLTAPARAVALGPSNTFDLARADRRGPDLVVAWTTRARPGIQIALVAP
jgi:hypothetical protein